MEYIDNMKKKVSRNPIARVCGRVNKPKVVPAKKGKGAAYKRIKRVDYVD
jgi:hypothetical protein